MKSTLTIAIFVISVSLSAQSKIDSTVWWLDLNSKTVEEFIEMLPIDVYSKPNLYILTIGTKAEVGWVKESDLSILIDLMDCKKKAFCIMQAISSQLPVGETSTIGGIAMDLIDSFRNRSEYPMGLTTCTGDNRKRRKEIQNWYSEYKKKNGC